MQNLSLLSDTSGDQFCEQTVSRIGLLTRVLVFAGAGAVLPRHCAEARNQAQGNSGAFRWDALPARRSRNRWRAASSILCWSR